MRNSPVAKTPQKIRRILSHYGRAARFVCREFEGKLAGGGIGKKTKRRAIVGYPVGAGVEQNGIFDGSAQGENAGSGGFAGPNAEGGIFDDDATLWFEMKVSGAFEIRLGIRFAALDIGSGDEVDDVRPETGGAKAHFSEGARGGSDYGKLRRGNRGEQ